MVTGTLSRIQFGISIGFHFIFPSLTLGLALVILILEWRYLRSSEEETRKISAFLIRIFGVVFSLGVATGVIMPFSFGSNWSRFSEFAGGVFGTTLMFEAVTAFMLESVFFGILMFGRKKVSKTVYFTSALMVFIGSHLSAFWILSANSWMHSPAGFSIVDGKAVLTDMFKVVFNPTMVIRFIHTVNAAWLTGAVFAAGIAAILLKRGGRPKPILRLLALATVIALVTSIAQPIIGHQQIMSVLRNEPEKDAAYEGIFKTVDGAPLIGFGIPDQKNRRIRFALGIPKALSFLESGNFNSTVKGLEEYPEKEWPPVNVIFTTFHIMVPLAIVLLGIEVVAAFLLWKKKLEKNRLALTALSLAIPLPILANELGWIGAETGRQPWVVYKLLATADAFSPNLPASSVVVSLAVFCLVYAALFALFVALVRAIVRDGIRE
ncbi:MAG: cytochrome ubiquinol oxidase subunit I [Rectinemataceae bacterium]|nr:cytochrome ubiquinol oxidase subunit I [Rectinemataceae bacterium]